MDEVFESDNQIQKDSQELGPVRAFQKHREEIVKRLREEDPAYWDRFVEAQEKARANVQVSTAEAKPVIQPEQESAIADEEAIADE